MFSPMKKTIPTTASLVSLIFLLSCTKDEVPNNTIIIEEQVAQFSLDTADKCSAVNSSGVFNSGVPLSTGHELTAKVIVHQEGNYTISTDTLNGYYFSASGKFDTTGIHVVTLSGYGTPQSPGNSRFSLAAGETHLRFTVPVIDETMQLESVPDGIYLKGTFGYDSIHIVSPKTVDDVMYDGGNNQDTAYFHSYVQPPAAYPLEPGTGGFTLQRHYMYNFQSSTEGQFKEFFKPGAYPIAYKACENGDFTEGVFLGLFDQQDWAWMITKDWDQEGSYFKIVGIEDGHNANGNYFVKIKAKFSCKVYKNTTTEMKKINAEVVSYFIRSKP